MKLSRRFPDDVREVLSAAGWRPDRDVSTLVSAWLLRVPLPIFPAARRMLDEFGGLRFRQLKRPGSATGGFDVEVWPTDGRVMVDLFTEVGADIGAAVFPLAWYEDGPSDIAICADGRVFLLHPAGEFLIGATPDTAMVSLVRGEAFTEVDL